jgi:hypothetical protein
MELLVRMLQVSSALWEEALHGRALRVDDAIAGQDM